MSLDMFLDNIATVTRTTATNTNGVESFSTTTIYNGIKCHIYSLRGKLDDTTIAVNTADNMWAVIVEPTSSNIRLGDILEISDPLLWAIGKYQIVSQPKANRLIDGSVDSIQFSCKQI